MELGELKSKIQTNTIPNLLVFIGTEWAVQKIYIKQISKVTGMPLKYVDTVGEILPKLGSKSLAGSNNQVYIVQDDTKFMSNQKQQKKLVDISYKSIVILLISKADKRLKFFNTYKALTVEFNPLSPEILAQYIQREIGLSQKNCLKLAEVCENNYGRILLEIDKIKCYDARVSENEEDAGLWDLSFKSLLADGTIYTPPKDAVFDLVDAILDRKRSKSFELYDNCKGVGESSFIIMTNLFNSAKAVLQVQTCIRKNKISESTGLSGWQINNAKKHIGVYSDEELEDLIELVVNCSQGIKKGLIDEKYVIDYILVNTL